MSSPHVSEYSENKEVSLALKKAYKPSLQFLKAMFCF